MTNLSLINRFFAFTLLLVSSLLLPATSQAQQATPPLSPIQQTLESYRHSGSMQPVQLWRVSKNLMDLRAAVDKATLLELDANATNLVWETAPEALSMELPNVYGEDFVLELAKVDILAPDFKLGTLGVHAQDNLPYQSGVHYRGSLAGDPQAIVAFSFFPNGVMGLIANKDGNYTVGKLEDGSERYVIYRSADLRESNPARCLADELPVHAQQEEAVESRGGACGGGVQIYFECDYKLYTDKNSDETEVTNYITGLFNQVSALYANESVNVAISQIQIWSSPDPYTPYSSTSSVLSAFRNTLGVSYNGNLAHFLTTRNLGGGIAFLDVLCAKSSAFGVSAISTTYKNVPTYSWSVEVLTHELGHNLGSWHTHSCNWPGGPIDNCYNQEGSCSPGAPPANGGTIMSYCHLTSIGINLSNGFGPLPGDRIRSRIAAASCLSSAGGGSSTAPTGLSSANITAGAATLSWTNGGATGSFTVQYKKNGTTSWQTGGTVSTLSYTLNGLLPNTKYDWQVKSACSPYSATATFTTGAGTSNCTAPGGLTTSNLASTSAQCNWTAISGATQYTIEYKLSTATTWTQAGTSAQNSYLLSGLSSAKAYNWRVKANCSAFSSSVSFTTTSTPIGGGGGGTCNKPTGLSSVILSSTSARLAWGAVSGAANYTLQIRRQGATSWFTLGTVSVVSVRLIGLTPNQNYEWRLKANCSVWSDPALLFAPSMLPDAAPQDAAIIPTLNVYPNPTNGLLTVNPGLRLEEALWIELSDATGRRVLEQQAVAAAPLSVDLSPLQAGVYFLHLRSGDKRLETKRIVKF